MQDDKFNNILKNRAKEFVLLPNANAFDTILAGRKKVKRKRFFVFASVFVFLVGLSSTIFLVNNQNLESDNVNKITKLESKPNLSRAPIISNKVTENSDDEIIVKKNIVKQNGQIIKLLYNDKIVGKISNSNKASSNKTNIVILNKEVTINKSSESLNDFKLQEAKNASPYLDSFSVAKQAIDSSENEDSSFAYKTIVVKEINDSLQNSVAAKAVSTNQNSYKIKEPIHFSLSEFNHYMILNRAYNGADNELINSMFGLHYNDQANQSYSLGFLFGLTRKKMSLKFGFAYNNVQFDKLFIEPNSMGLGANINKGALINDFGYNINVIDQSLSFVEMPILLGYTFGNKKINYTLETGCAFQYLTQTNTYLLTSDVNGFSYNTRNDAGNNRFNQLQIAGQLSFLINYNLTKHISIYGGPLTKFHVGQYFKQEFTNRNAPIYFGLYSGINFKF
jgi:hypothetical protein